MASTSFLRPLGCMFGVCLMAGLEAGTAHSQQFAIDPDIQRKVEPAPPLANDPDGLVLEGLRLFTKETFNGNGRTCATCHPPTNNFTIDPEFIATLRPRDPLFVAEFNRNLSELENPDLMRRFGLILENLDGFDHAGLLRSVPHTLGLSQSVAPADSFPLEGMTGWSGDGAPLDGTLRSFAVGAVAQHFTKGMRREGCSASEAKVVPGRCDFRVPTEAELDAMLAFQLFLGRQNEVNIRPGSGSGEILFLDTLVEVGRDLFDSAPALDENGASGSRGCGGCHRNAGANDAGGKGRQRATGANLHPNAPACLVAGLPGDGGFGTNDVTTLSSADVCGSTEDYDIVFQGDMTFNIPSVIEAADSGPFFHNNIVDTIEDAVAFYNSDAFSESLDGEGRRFLLSEEQINQIAAFLRALNALDNLSNSDRFDELALRQARVRYPLARTAVEIAISETVDAIEVLTEGPVELYEATAVVDLLREAADLQREAIARHKLDLLTTAMERKGQARALMIEIRG